MECKPGQLIVINPGQLHGSSKNVRKASFISIFFDRMYIDGLIAEITGDSQQFPNYVQNLKPEVQELVTRMIEEYRESRYGRTRLLEAMSDQLAVFLIRYYHQPVFTADPAVESKLPFYQSRYSDVIDYMRLHLGEKITIDQMAEIAMMNRYHFIRSFRSSFGSSPYDYLTSMRISHAKNLLASTTLNASDISIRCGFFSPSRFSAAFRNATGMTPSKYRKHALAEKASFSERKPETTQEADLLQLQQNLAANTVSE
jgi:AraC-like DNA-binding protein